MKTNTVTTVWKRNMQFETDNPSGHKVLLDTSKENGGDGTGLSPKAMMLSALAGCTGLDVISILKKMRTAIDDFKIEITGELTEQHPKYYHKVGVNYHFYGAHLEEKKLTKAVDLSAEKYCGVMAMFQKFAAVETKLFFHRAS